MKVGFFILFAITIASCSKEIQLPDDDASRIFGDWDFYKSYVFWGGWDTADLSDAKIDITITSQGHFIRFENNVEISDKKFTLSNLPDGGYGYLIDFNDKSERDLVVQNFSEDSISLVEYGWNDATIFYYERMQ